MRRAPLTSTPLADRIAFLEKAYAQAVTSLKNRAEKAEAERDALRAQVEAARRIAEEMSNDTFDGDGATAAAGTQVLDAMDEAKK